MRTRWVALSLVAAACVATAAVAALERDESAGRPGAGAPADIQPAVVADGRTVSVVWVARDRLRAVARLRLRVGAGVEGWALSPDRSRLVLGGRRGGSVRVVDVRRMRVLGEVALGGLRGTVAGVWGEQGRLLVVLAQPGCCAAGSTTIVALDAGGRRQQWRRRLRGGLTRVAGTRHGLVLLLAPSAMLGPATVATVSLDGHVRSARLDGLSAGVVAPAAGADPPIVRVRRPGLAVEPTGARAYVIPGRREAAEVDLRRMRVSYHALTEHRSLLDRLRELFDASAQAASVVGYERTARWLPGGRLAITGHDAHVWLRGGGPESTSRPAGLQLVDTRGWRVRTLDPQATAFRSLAGRLVATGGDQGGVRAYELDGRPAFEMLDGRPVEIQAAAGGSRVYLNERGGRRLHIVDGSRGELIRTLEGHPPPIPADPGAGPWR